MKTRILAIRLPSDLFEALDVICNRLGVQKNFIVEAAIREKVEDLIDVEDLREAMKEATRFHSWEDVKVEVGQKGGASNL
jgi:predicted DNA-binding protein